MSTAGDETRPKVKNNTDIHKRFKGGCVCVCAFFLKAAWEQSSVQLFEFKDEKSA